ncbi:MAG: HVO_0416 family zinc finger protein [Halobacteriaceae archaeon]
MATSSDPEEALFEEFLSDHGHSTPTAWDRSYNKLQCPECSALHDESATNCTVCGWVPGGD